MKMVVVNEKDEVLGYKERNDTSSGEIIRVAAVWVLNDNTRDVQIVDANTPGATWHANQYAGYAFMLRADGTRVLISPEEAGWSDYTSPAPEPSTYAMFGMGLLAMGAIARRRKAA